MTYAIAMSYAPSPFRDTMTAAGSSQGIDFTSRIHSWLSGERRTWASAAQTLEERLSATLLQMHSAVQQRARYLGRDLTRQLNARLSDLFNPEEWEEGEPLPTFQSASALMTAICDLGAPSSIGISRQGNLNAIWREGSKGMTIEGLANGRLAWAIAEETDNEIKHQSNSDSTLAELRTAMGQS